MEFRNYEDLDKGINYTVEDKEETNKINTNKKKWKTCLFISFPFVFIIGLIVVYIFIFRKEKTNPEPFNPGMIILRLTDDNLRKTNENNNTPKVIQLISE
ncbi:MAG: hypothetical protein MJ252_19015, partial [archaeon]|nr:hypothetical protein [archaeon]